MEDGCKSQVWLELLVHLTLGGLEPLGLCGDVAGTVLAIPTLVLVMSVPAFISGCHLQDQE